MAVDLDKLNKLAGRSTTPQKVVGAMNEGQDTIDKVKSIVEGVNAIFTKVQQFRPPQQQAPPQQAPVIPHENAPQSAPVDMQSNKRAIVKIDDEKLLNFIKEFSKNIPAPVLEMPLKDLIAQGEGNEQMIRGYLLNAIKEVVSVEYVE